MYTFLPDHPAYPKALLTLADPPGRLFVRGELTQLLAMPCVAIVGSRKVTAYGKSITLQLGQELARSGICIVSGLAIGVDGLAHQAALEAGGATLAVLPSGVEQIYPASHRTLAERILQSGGALMSEYPPAAIPYKLNFIARNRIVAALAQAVLITEAAAKSGTLHTARFALEQGKEVLAVPGNITSEMSAGTNTLIKAGATPVTSVADVLRALGMQPQKKRASVPKDDTPEEQLIIDHIAGGMVDGSELLATVGLEIRAFNQALTMLEISGHIRPLGANMWGLVG